MTRHDTLTRCADEEQSPAMEKDIVVLYYKRKARDKESIEMGVGIMRD